MKISESELKKHFSTYLRLVESGKVDSLIIERHGKAVVKMTAASESAGEAEEYNSVMRVLVM